MNFILDLINDPGWWFTTCLMGIVVSVIGSYFRDGLSAALSLTSTTVRANRQKRLEKEKSRIEKLVLHPNILIMDMLKLVLLSISCMGNLAVCVGLPAYHDVVMRTTDSRILLETLSVSFLLIMSFSGAVSVYSSFKIGSFLRVLLIVCRRYEQKIS